jgi:hypothetical protein
VTREDGMDEREDERGVVDGELWSSVLLLSLVLVPLLLLGVVAGGVH